MPLRSGTRKLVVKAGQVVTQLRSPTGEAIGNAGTQGANNG